MVVFDDHLFSVIPLDVLAVDFGAGRLALAEGANVEVVVEDALDGDDRPGVFDLPFILRPFRFFAELLRHAGGRDALGGEVVGDLFVAPAVVVVEAEDAADDVRLGGDDLELLLFVDDVAVGGGADPLAVQLAAFDDVPDLFGGVGDRHLVDQELELDFQPVVVVREVDVVADRDDPGPGVPQVLQLDQAAAVAAGEAGEVFDNQDVVLMVHQAPAHLLVALPLLEGVAGAVPVFVEGEAAAGEVLADVVGNDGFLVFD